MRLGLCLLRRATDSDDGRLTVFRLNVSPLPTFAHTDHLHRYSTGDIMNTIEVAFFFSLKR